MICRFLAPTVLGWIPSTLCNWWSAWRKHLALEFQIRTSHALLSRQSIPSTTTSSSNQESRPKESQGSPERALQNWDLRYVASEPRYESADPVPDRFLSIELTIS